MSEAELIECSIGITAYNEEANIGRLLDAILSQQTRRVKVRQVIVVASGCSDRTEEIVQTYARQHPSVVLVRQAHREGKASAVNLLLRHVTAPITVLISADTLPVPAAIEELVSPLADPAVGMVGGRPVPTNPVDTLLGFGVHLLWDLHHQISLRSPKMGELIAFRNVFHQIPPNTAVDEASIEPVILGQGLCLRYAPEAVVYNRGPETLGDFVKQRRRIYIGHLHIKDTLGYQVSTMNGLRIALLYVRGLRPDWRYLAWGPIIAFLELAVRLLAMYDYYVRRKNPYVWPVAETTKDLKQVL